MTGKPVRPRALARKDVDDAVDWYTREATPDIALGFVDALQKAYRSTATRRAAGSPRYARELDFSGASQQARRPFRLHRLYVEGHDHIDVWRVLHRHRDIPGAINDDL